MVIGFHYHIPVKVSPDGKYFTQSFFGLFLDSISDGCEELILFAYSPVPAEEALINYQIRAVNVSVVGLGPHNSLPKRITRFWAARRSLLKSLNKIDLFLVRAPTPLLVIFTTLRKHRPVVMYLVGDYFETSLALPFWKIKTMLIKLIGLAVNSAQTVLARDNLVLTNSKTLQDKYIHISSRVEVIRSTTLTPEDFYYREDTCQSPLIKILFTGRMDPLKGLFELVEACNEIVKSGVRLELHMAGLLLKGLEDLPDQLINAGRGDFRNRIFYHGTKKVGDELNALYRNADIYVIASKGVEGFPRTIWEALANGLPVIASKIGSIPSFLEHKKEAFLVRPGDSKEIEQALCRLIRDNALRKHLIYNGYKLASENTLEIQGRRMTDVLKDYIASR